MLTRTCPIAHPLHVHAASGHTKHPCCKHPLYELLQGQALLLSQETSLLVLGPHLRVGQEASCDCFHDAVLQLLCIVRDNQLHRHVCTSPLSLHWEGSSAGQSDRKRVTTRRRECHACRYCSLPTSAAVAVAAAGTVALLLHSTPNNCWDRTWYTTPQPPRPMSVRLRRSCWSKCTVPGLSYWFTSCRNLASTSDAIDAWRWSDSTDKFPESTDMLPHVSEDRTEPLQLCGLFSPPPCPGPNSRECMRLMLADVKPDRWPGMCGPTPCAPA